MIHSLHFCLVIVVHESLVCPEQLNILLFFRKILQASQTLWFSSIFVYLNPFNSDCMILRSIFSHWGQLRDSFTTITEDPNAHWCSRRKNDALGAGVRKLFEFQDQGKFNLICLQETGKYLLKGSTKCKTMIFRQNKKNIHIFILFKSFHALSLIRPVS